MRKHVLVIVVMVLVGLLATGCNANKEVNDQSFTNGNVYDDLSERFKITVYPTKLITEDGKKNIVYSLAVDNKSEEAYKNFTLTITMNKDLDQYIAAGVFSFPVANFDMAAKSDPGNDNGKGAEVEFQQLLSDDQFMSEAGIKYQDILELGKSFELHLKWDGGEEKYQLTSDVIDEITPSNNNAR